MSAPPVRGLLRLVLLVLAGLAWAGPAQAYIAVVPDASSGSRTVASFDTTTNAPGGSVSGGVSMLGAAIAPDARTAYVIAPGSNDITPIDVSGSAPVAGTPVDLTGGASGHAVSYIAISPDGRKAYVPDGPVGGTSQVIVVDLTGPTPVVAGRIAVGSHPDHIAFTPDGSRAYVANSADGTITPITVATDTPGLPITIAAGSHPSGIAITPDGHTAYVTDNGSDKVYPVTLPAGPAGSPITVGSGPDGIAITPDGSKAYVTNNGTENGSTGSGMTVTPITLATNTPRSPVTVGPGPWAVAITPDGQTAHVTSADGVYPIDVATDTPGTPIPLGIVGRSIAITPDQAPVASFTPAGSQPGSPVTFDASASTVRFGTIVSYAWDFGDGTTQTTTAPTITHSYAAAGNYTATVTETDSAGTSTGGTVYTGQTAYRVGSASARAARSVVITPAPAPAVTLSATRLDFGTLAVGDHSPAQTVTVTNTGSAPLHLGGASINGVTPADFAVGGDTCAGQTVATGATCSMTVSFTPAASASFSAVLAVTGDATGSPYTVALSGTGTTTGAVAGTVEDGTRAGHPPLAGAAVRLCHQVTLAGCSGTYTSADGRYHFTGVTPGAYDLEVFPPSGSGLANGSRVATVGAGQTDDAITLLGHDNPLPQSITFSSPRGTQQGGHPFLYWNDPFSIGLPTLKPLSAHGTPNTTVDTTIFVRLEPEGSTQTAIGSALTYRVSYDAHGNAGRGLVVDTSLPGIVPGGFGAQLGDTAVAPGTTALVSAASVLAATHATVSSSGLQQLVHGTVQLSILPLRHVAAVSATGSTAASPTAHAGGLCENLNADVAQLEALESQLVSKIQADQGLINGGDSMNGAYKLLVDESALRNVQEALLALADQQAYSMCDQPPGGPFSMCDNIFNADLSSDCPAGGMVPVDPSGYVRSTTGIPLQRAKVVLQRSDSAAGPFRQPPNGNAVMSAHNRRNPDFTDINGHFGWDVFPGFYRVRATSRGCRGAALTRARAVPPPVTNLLLELRCPGLRRTITHTRILGTTKAGPSFAVTLRTRAGRAHVIGMVAVSAGRRLHAFGFLGRDGRVRITLPRRPARRARVTVRYTGNARFAPSSASRTA